MAALCVGLAGCGTAEQGTAVEQVEYTWQSTGKQGHWHKGDGWIKRPAGEAGSLRVSFVAPGETELDPAVSIDPASIIPPIVQRADIDGTVIAERNHTLPIYALPGNPQGKSITFELTGPGAGRIDAFYVGSQRRLVEAVLKNNLPTFFVGLFITFSGFALMLSAARRGANRAYLFLGVFAFTCGLANASETSELRGLLLNDQEIWRWLMSFAVLSYPIAFSALIDQIFVDPQRQFLRRFRRVAGGWMALSLVLELAGVFPLHDARRAGLLMALFVAISSIAIAARRAKRDTAARIFLAGFAIFISLSMTGLFGGLLGISGLPVMTHWGLLTFVLSIGFVVSHQFQTQARQLASTSATLAEKVNLLEEQKTQVESLNQELRHQIAERARTLLRLFSTAGNKGHRLLQTGDLIDGRYKVIQELGAGAMGQVFAVQRLSDTSLFALKVMTGQSSSSQRARFAREAEIAARLHHDNLVAVHDVGIDASGLLYLVMELVKGGTLEETLSEPVEIAWGVARLREIGQGLVTLHGAGIVHRDLKPSNILLEDMGNQMVRAKIADFGIARWNEDDPHAIALDETMAPASSAFSDDAALPLSETVAPADDNDFDTQPAVVVREKKKPIPSPIRARITATHAMIGTPMFMAPELAIPGAKSTFASDIFSLGLIAVEMFTGQFPFTAPPMVLAQAGAYAPPTQAMEGLPPPLEGVLLRALHQDPQQRPSAKELVDVLSGL